MADLLNEAVLKLASLAIRVGQLAFSLAIVGCASQFATTIYNRDVAVPETVVAVASMAGVASLWSVIALLVTLCAGKVMLEVEATMDFLCTAMSIAQAALLSEDALCSLREFARRYRQVVLAGYLPDKGLMRASFVMAIVNITLFAATSLMSLSVALIRRRHESREKHEHEHEHDHDHDHEHGHHQHHRH